MISKKEAIRLHREMWNWLYHHPTKAKDDWPEWEKNDGPIAEGPFGVWCFLCYFDCCILDWSPYTDCMKGKGEKVSFYRRWQRAKSPKTRKKYAKIIRDLPEGL